MFHLNFSKAIKELIYYSKFGPLQNERKWHDVTNIEWNDG